MKYPLDRYHASVEEGACVNGILALGHQVIGPGRPDALAYEGGWTMPEAHLHEVAW